MAGAAFEHAHEWPCQSCEDLQVSADFGLSIEPPEARCYAEECTVDIECLRELEAQVALAAHYLNGMMRICTVKEHADAHEAIEEAIAEALAALYGDVPVPEASIKSRIETLQEKMAVMP